MANSEFQKQLSKLRRDKKILWFAILLFVLVVLWILTGIFATTKTSSITPELRELARPFVPRLESRVFEEIEAQEMIVDQELSFFPIYVFDRSNMGGEMRVVNIMDFVETSENEPNDNTEAADIQESERTPVGPPEVLPDSTTEASDL